MKWLGFLFFLTVSLLYIWNRKDHFSKKSWLLFGLSFIGVIIGTIIFGFALKNIMLVWPVITVSTAKFLTMAVGASFTAVLAMKFLVVMLCTMFLGFMRFHKKYNSENYQAFSSLSNVFSPSLLILVKCVVSCGSVLIFYGIWLA
ncbi:hypothetical protein [Erwinia piriflorinigrans]|uniref:Uncharacterized protein n=1 Tax=Erwinia piriflorinigrans CFBP 5888 TaxID=1161919 RepID=V5ZBW7_9GAMM|nr:hypothetical protein [Erwinia piriflorinigrans]CCG88421.1 hypothetical protein EPIR_3058 [Erwinia piriflorinigrans CFBP 5888]